MKLLTFISLSGLIISMNASADIRIPSLLNNLHKKLGNRVNYCKLDCWDKTKNDLKEKRLSLYIDHLIEDHHLGGYGVDESQRFTVTGGTDNHGRACGFTFSYGTQLDTGKEHTIKRLTYISNNDNGISGHGLDRNMEDSIFVIGWARETRNSFKISEPRYAFSGKDRDTLSLKSTKKKLVVKSDSAREVCVKYGKRGEDFLGKEYRECLEKKWEKHSFTCTINI